MPAEPLNAVVQAILGRRSIRRGFDGQPVPRAVLDEVLACGCAAPSSKDAQPWRLHPIADRVELRAIATVMRACDDAARYVPIDPSSGRPRETFVSSVHESAEVLGQVPLAIFIENDGSFSGDRERLARARRATLPEALVGYAFELIGLGAAIQNMWLAAHAHGLAGVFIGDVLIAEAEVRRRLEMDGDLVGVLALGRSASPPRAPRSLAKDRVRSIRG